VFVTWLLLLIIAANINKYILRAIYTEVICTMAYFDLISKLTKSMGMGKVN